MVIIRRKLIRMVSFSIAIVLFLSCMAPIASARGSLYISNYSATMEAGNNGYVSIGYHITGTDVMDVIGAISVTIYENGVAVKNYSDTNTPGLLAYNVGIHWKTLTYAGTVGKKYSAYVTYKAGRDGGWDNRGLDSNSVYAKN